MTVSCRLSLTGDISVSNSFNGSDFYIPWDAATNTDIWTDSTSTFYDLTGGGSVGPLLQYNQVIRVPEGATWGIAKFGVEVANPNGGSSSGIYAAHCVRTLSPTGGTPPSHTGTSNGGNGMAKSRGAYSGSFVRAWSEFGPTTVSETQLDGSSEFDGGHYFTFRVYMTGVGTSGYTIKATDKTFAEVIYR